MTPIKSLLLAAAFAMSVGAARAENASDYPSGPVKVIVPFAPGGATDVARRRRSLAWSSAADSALG